jgi:predicted metalloprotease
MEWEGREESQNVDDRRGRGVKTGLAVGGGGVIILIIAYFLGIDPQKLAQFMPQDQQQQQDQAQGPADPAEERLAKFTKVILHDTEVVWDDLFKKMGKTYVKPTLVLFSGKVESACGLADAAVGPFYCPGDSQVYIDLSFYKDMEKKLNAPGEFARAYVIAHEVGHHVQKLLDYSRRVDEARRDYGAKSVESHRMSVRLELQADYLAGVWAHHGQKRFNFLDKGDIESALNAAFEIGDDRLQKKGQGYVVPDTFTHGTSEQRMRWFKRGFEVGSVERASALFDLPYEKL